MRFKDFMTEYDYQERIDEAIVLGQNTWLFLEHPLFEDIYYPVDGALSEDEVSHFNLLNEITREEKADRKLKSAEFQASKDSQPKGEWDTEVEKAFKDITKKSKKSFHALTDLEKKSFIGKYVLHGLESPNVTGKGWGRQASFGRKPKEIYSDALQSYKEKQKFANDVIKMYKDWKAEQKEGEAKLNDVMKRFTSIVDFEASLGKSKDGFTSKLFEWTKDKFGKGWFPEEAYLEYLFKIRAKQYNSQKELEDCVKQWSAIGGNTKTKASVDISTVCPKREKLLEMMQDWSQAHKDLEEAIVSGAEDSRIKSLQTRADSLKVTDANNPTCAYCYVESAREIAKKHPKYFLAKAEKRGLRYQDTFKKWLNKEKDGTFKQEKDGNLQLTTKGLKQVADLNKMGGLRFFSSGDYIEDQSTDKEIERIIDDAQLVGLQLKAITKQEKFVKKYGGRVFTEGPLKGKPVFNINMSVDEQMGFKLAIAKNLKRSYPGNVNIRVVARNPQEAINYSKDPAVDVITLLHFGSAKSSRMSNKELYQNMSPGSQGWKSAIEGMKKVHPKANWNKVLSKICCATSHCKTCPNACGFNPRRVADYAQLAKGGKKVLKTII